MPSRSDHTHELQIISHNEDFSKVLVNCRKLTCNLVEVRKPKPRKGDKFAEEVKAMRHLCCE